MDIIDIILNACNILFNSLLMPLLRYQHTTNSDTWYILILSITYILFSALTMSAAIISNMKFLSVFYSRRRLAIYCPNSKLCLKTELKLNFCVLWFQGGLLEVLLCFQSKSVNERCSERCREINRIHIPSDEPLAVSLLSSNTIKSFGLIKSEATIKD